MISISRFGRKYDLVSRRCSKIEGDLNDLTPNDNIYDVLGCDGALHVRLVDSQALVSLAGNT